MEQTAREMLERYVSQLPEAVPWMLLGALVLALGVGLTRKVPARWLSVLGVLAALVVGLDLVWEQRSLVDDAFVSFRYADNFLQGHGLVYNHGERVEGYTNFLWTLLLVVGASLTPLSIPHTALLLGLFTYLALIAALVLASRELARARGDEALPIAAILLAVHGVITSFATTGLETLMGLLLVTGMVLFLGRVPTLGNVAMAGLCGALAMINRLDHALFVGAAGLAVLATEPSVVAPLRNPASRKRLMAFLAPFLLVVGMLVFKLAYYGDILPNTAYAKEVAGWRVDMGLLYGLVFALGTHLWLLLPLFVVGVLLPAASRPQRVVRVTAAVAVPLWVLYVLKVGGDFMYGRFWLPMLPLIALVLDDLVARGTRRHLALGLGAAAVVGLTLRDVAMLERGRQRWHLADEGSIYELTSIDPVVVDHPSWIDGNVLGKALTDRGITPTIATCCIGMVGYYSRLELIDTHGLTDRRVARQKIDEAREGKPGHEKIAKIGYLRKRGVKLARYGAHPRRYRELSDIEIEGNWKQRWGILIYDRELMRRIAQQAPEIGFVDFEGWLDDYIAELDGKDPAEVARDLRWFDDYYFDHNDDVERRRSIAVVAGNE